MKHRSTTLIAPLCKTGMKTQDMSKSILSRVHVALRNGIQRNYVASTGYFNWRHCL